MTKRGYVILWTAGGPRPEHILIAEQVLGRKMKAGEQVHHIDGDKAHNAHTNLLICTSVYHGWLHAEMGRRYQKEHFGRK